MPAHWYYSVENIYKQWEGGISGFEAPPHPHPESFMIGMSYDPDVEKAKELGRSYDILHENAKYYRTSYSKFEFDTNQRESEHGNATTALMQRMHYHHGLTKGENTLHAHLTRVLLRAVGRDKKYDPNAFTNDFISFLTTPGPGNNDPYREICVRRWFENYSKGLPPSQCAADQRDVWSVGSTGGMIRPMVLAMLAPNTYQAMGVGIEHSLITQRSLNVYSALGIAVPLIRDLVDGVEYGTALKEHGSKCHAPKITGEEMFASYRSAAGPGNIPKDEKFRQHVELELAPMDLEQLAALPEDQVVRSKIGTACYTEQTLALNMYHAAKYPKDAKTAILAGVNAGGDNVHRCMVLGMITGAQDPRIKDLAAGLKDYQEIAKEIKAFADVAVAEGQNALC